MNRTRMSALLIAIPLLAAGLQLWTWHAREWNVGGASVLGYDAAQYALAARELAERGRLVTPFALPLELSKHPAPPWPLALVQPGLVIAEAALLRVSPGVSDRAMPGRGAWVVLVIPLLGYLATSVLLAWVTLALLERLAPDLAPTARGAAAAVIGFYFLFDPEAQHFAVGGFTELPFTLGLVAAVGAIASGLAARRPLAFGVLLGIAGSFRGNMLWLAPVFAATAAAGAARGARARTFATALVGFCLPLLPWWVYKWRAFGSPGWDLSWISIWDGVGGRTWFSLNHLPELPELPSGSAAAGAIAAKVARNLPRLALDLTIGPRGLWIAGLAFWLLAERMAPRDEAGLDRGHAAARMAGLAALAVVTLSAVVAAASVPILRYLFPARVVVEAAGIVALWGLIARAPEPSFGPRVRRWLQVGVAAIALLWGALQTTRGWSEGRAASASRGVPSSEALVQLSRSMAGEMRPDEPVMSNLGPILAWYARRPVVHLALSPADVEACRRRLDLRYVLLVFRQAERAWPEWVPVMEHPAEAPLHPEWNIVRARHSETRDGFQVVWLELGPLAPRMAER